MMGLGINVGKLVEHRGVSYGDVARGVGIEDSQAIWLLVDRKSRKSKYASQLADFFGVPLTRLLADDFDVSEASSTSKTPTISLQIEEAEAIQRLRKALPDWRSYVLGLAMEDSPETQQLLLDSMRRAVPDGRVEKFVSVAPHAAARIRESEKRK